VAVDFGLKLEAKSDTSLLFRESFPRRSVRLAVRLSEERLRTHLVVLAGKSEEARKDPRGQRYVEALAVAYLAAVGSEAQTGLIRLGLQKKATRPLPLRVVALAPWVAALAAVGLFAIGWAYSLPFYGYAATGLFIMVFKASEVVRRRILGLAWRDSMRESLWSLGVEVLGLVPALMAALFE
jgi:hypothetical protein